MRIIQTNHYQIAATEYGESSAEKLAILLPGRLDSRDYVNFVSHGNFLAGLGYYAIALDPPGTWDSPGELSLYTTSNYVEAVNELIAALGNRPTLLLGHSRGGATAMLASGNSQVEAIAVVNAAYGAPSAPDPTKLVGGCLPETRDEPPADKPMDTQRTFMLPMSYFEDGKKHNPTASLKAYAGAKLIMHASGDEFHTVDQVRAIFDELSEPKTFLELDGDHDYRLNHDAVAQVNVALSKFCAEI